MDAPRRTNELPVVAALAEMLERMAGLDSARYLAEDTKMKRLNIASANLVTAMATLNNLIIDVAKSPNETLTANVLNAFERAHNGVNGLIENIRENPRV